MEVNVTICNINKRWDNPNPKKKKNKDEPMQNPWTRIVGHKTKCHVVSCQTNIDNITLDGVFKVIYRTSCTSNNMESML